MECARRSRSSRSGARKPGLTIVSHGGFDVQEQLQKKVSRSHRSACTLFRASFRRRYHWRNHFDNVAVALDGLGAEARAGAACRVHCCSGRPCTARYFSRQHSWACSFSACGCPASRGCPHSASISPCICLTISACFVSSISARTLSPLSSRIPDCSQRSRNRRSISVVSCSASMLICKSR
jgi:hypothetical protein